jgi:cyclophilin family peptidyl-prolyl cis-trans isomerase
MLARQGKYNDVIFHRLVAGFMVNTHLIWLTTITDTLADSNR